MSLAKSTDTTPFSPSKTATSAAAFLPITRSVLVAPALPLPSFLISFPLREENIIAVFILPRR